MANREMETINIIRKYSQKTIRLVAKAIPASLASADVSFWEFKP